MSYFLVPKIQLTHADNCGCAMLNPGWIHPRRRLSSSVVILGRKGSACIDENDRSIEICPDRVCILAADRFHEGTKAILAPASYFWLHFTGPEPPVCLEDDSAAVILGNQELLKQRLSDAVLVRQEMALDEPERFHRLFHDLLFEQERPSFSPWKFQLLFQLLMMQLSECVVQRHTAYKDVPLGSSLTYAVLANVAESLTDPNLSVKSISAALNHNPDYLGRQFKQTMRLSVGEFILQKRIKLAVTLLQDSYASMNEIADRCGFGSLRNFLRQFKAVQGMTPATLRTRYRAMHINN